MKKKRNKTFFKVVKSSSPTGFERYRPEEIPRYKHINNSSRWYASNALDDTAEWAKIPWHDLIVCKFRPDGTKKWPSPLQNEKFKRFIGVRWAIYKKV